jgi:serine/threonine-protein kinase RsbW
MPGADGQLGRRPDAAGLHLVLPAIAVSLPIVRHRLRAWLATLDWPTPAAEDLEFVLSEAVTNVVEHAYPPPDRPDPATPLSGDEAATAPKETVEILAAVQLLDEQARRVRVEVVDRGRWRVPPVNPGYRGRGLITMAAMTDQMSIKPATPGLAGHPFHLAAGGIPVNHPTFPRGGTTHPGRKRRDDRHGRRIGRSQ